MAQPDIGSMTYRVRIERAENARDSMNESVPDWEAVQTVWGEVIQLTGRVFWQAQAAGSEITHTVRMWLRTDIRPIAYRLVVDGDVLEIDSTAKLGKTWLLCHCRLTKQG